MNTLFFIGNGFDINLGLETRYKDFYKYYMSKESPNKLVEELKKNIKENIENWSDLEKKLGEYTKELNKENDFFEVFDDIRENLSNYLEKIESEFDHSIYNNGLLLEHLSIPEKFLSTADFNQIRTYRADFYNHISIMTLNYTSTLEKIINTKVFPISIANRSSIIQIEHIHGFSNDRMILGVNDTAQIENKDFQENDRINNALIKSVCNKGIGHTIDDWCINQIQDSHLICIFGSSLGCTDKIWFEFIGNKLASECKLIIFDVAEKINKRDSFKEKIKKDKLKKDFLNLTNLDEETKNRVIDNIYVGINTDMFKINQM